MENQSQYGGFDVVPQHRQQAGALVEVEQQRAIAETQAALIIAKRFPRDQIAALDRIVMACQRQGLAESALYSYARGGTEVTGPSIRLAEAIAQNWGNLQFGIRELSQSNGESTVEAFAWDVETNTRQVKVFQVQHKRFTKKGTYQLEDPRDIYEMVANQGARRLRACILGVIPGDVVESAVKQCEDTLKTKAEITPDRIKAMVEKFEAYKVTRAMIEKRIQRKLDAIAPAQFVSLGKIYNSLRDGMSTAADWFESGQPAVSEAAQKGNDGLKAKLSEPTLPSAPNDPTARENWINLRGAGFGAYVREHEAAFMAAQMEIKREANEKWKKLYASEPSPFEPQPVHESDPEAPTIAPEPKASPAASGEAEPPRGAPLPDYRNGAEWDEYRDACEMFDSEVLSMAMKNLVIAAVVTSEDAGKVAAEMRKIATLQGKF